ncbi:sulfurase [Lentzea guizhouensis]|uniref:Sulfurase n=1 Tax=Lentzea guizhouensis TaxID=1586287 RepID=A0A1B2HRC9_9PSEU|nr:MOSC domain-containing protein [Lentzea guizhouensis]ANZ40261.1 sulfurase [Lentzea guizhouensis]
MTDARVTVVSTGAVRQLPWHGRDVATAIAKTPTPEPVEVGLLGLAGDEQGDRENHGGPDKAVLLYPGEHYAAWAQEVGELPIPGFGENLTTSGLLETDVVLGAVYEIGTVVLQVSQPRRPCYKLAAHHGIGDMAVRTQRTGRTGFYCRVLRPGQLVRGAGVVLVTRPSHGITAAEVHRVVNLDRDDLDGARRLLDHAGVLPQSWAKMLHRRLDGRLDSQVERLHG